MATPATLAPVPVSIRTILFATDFSSASEAVLPYARGLARQFDAELIVVHVVVPELVNAEPPIAYVPKTLAVRRMEDLQVTEQLDGVRHREIVDEGDVWSVLSDIIDENRVDLLVMATHGRTGWRKFIIGSVAEDIFRHAQCPVLTIGPNVAADLRRNPAFDRILLGVDLRSEAHVALEFALGLAVRQHSELTLATVLEKPDPADPKLQIAATSHTLIQTLPADVNKWCRTDAIVSFGKPADSLVHIAEDRRTQLIILGAHRPTPLTTHLMDTAYQVVCEAPCPVLTVRE